MEFVHYRRSDRLVDVMRAFQVLRGLDRYYPQFDDWYVNKCVPAILSGTDGLLLAECGTRIVGVAIVKNAADEQKLRCVRVAQEFKGRGTAIHLMDRALRHLGCDKPAVTVPEELFHDWSRILFNRFEFSVQTVVKGAYRPGKLEYFFNGGLQPAAPYGRD